ncbi:MAG TPA: hypothetical protein PLP19_01970 [bacterium]|nr:hypothetical protein [bacterium]HPN42234.1 hypothetical protein [bacterium]
MNLLVTAAGLYIPAFIKKQKIRQLIKITAQAFQVETPDTGTLTYHECLHVFARFSGETAQRALQANADIQGIKSRLYKNACDMGIQLRRQLHIKTTAEVIQFTRILYKVIGIDYSCTPAGDVTIKRCYFSQFFNGEACRIFSALDEGVAAGLSNGGRLVFRERLTEGHSCCRADFRLTEEPL